MAHVDYHHPALASQRIQFTSQKDARTDGKLCIDRHVKPIDPNQPERHTEQQTRPLDPPYTGYRHRAQLDELRLGNLSVLPIVIDLEYHRPFIVQFPDCSA
ncbi:hypothetical protein Pst134EA_013380 [Puccinia striiformis f. sp. tritici]|uniref:hypothetical protein n=1 Tax=Puccinia striiformis f. sp. tritici TaxID=168172 RepID=UPI000A1253D4|nr:hypothetical protein Pst134EA_013380 [Puccinia striiformis f. sp. tritici]KAH9454254.1 hypothetical protein Pst134EB_014345 [Puccinia striiformis f. sp. tritici]KAH9465500.1 hypothetical protein Pst134EA_013380 [Puccinia striiformis f. sp. tritici]KAI9603758.1 hypothetical protein H4Q26_003358 [Puccinia striiformis f. sp. tritici PST-130]KAI9613651.1 hypothetical protein KEM48_003780 [Puccinia striiformis f. sp. tritici PST-130]